MENIQNPYYCSRLFHITKQFIPLSFFTLLSCFTAIITYAANDNYPVGSRAAAMSNASVMYPDFWSVYHNQAGLGFYDHFSIGFHHENKFVVPEFNLHSMAITIPTRTGTFGLSYTYFGYSEYNESKLGLSIGKSFHEKFAAGIQLDYLNTFIGDETGNSGTLAVEAGILAEPIDNLFIGFHVYNPTGSKQSKIVENNLVPTILRFGAGYRFSEKLFLGIETEKDLEVTPATFKSGIEYRIIQHVFARTGIMINDNVSHSFGVGFVLKGLRADVAFSHQQIIGYTPHFSIQFIFK